MSDCMTPNCVCMVMPMPDPLRTEAVHRIDLWYPRTGQHTPEQPTSVRVGLADVRAADDILIDYDFERDGYRIQMATVHEWDSVEDMQATGAGLVEVAFAPSWAPGSEKNPLAKRDPEPADGAARAAYEAAMAFQWSSSPFLPNSSAAIPWNDIGEESQRFWLKIAQAAVRKAAEDAGGELT